MTHGIEQVVERGMCIGCGACSVVTRGAIPLTLGRSGIHQARLDGVAESDRRVGSRVCPFSDEAVDETTLGAPTVEGRTLPFHEGLGHFGRVLAGRRVATDDLVRSSSGGLTSWLLRRLLETGEVDGVIHVGTRTGDELFGYTVSRSPDEVESRRKSQYYATTFRDVLLEVAGDGGRYAIVGVPCFIKAARLVCREDARLASQLRFFVGIVCGHLKSSFFAESLAWQVGVPPTELEAVDFRLKSPERTAADYDFGARAQGSTEFERRRTRSLVGGNWGHGAFQPEACNFCDDVFAETADVVFGDAWIPEFEADWRGTNIVVTRNALIAELLDEGRDRGELELDDVDPGAAARSQAGNFRHRRDGLKVRLADDIAAGLSVPRRRVQPELRHVSARRRRLIRQRRRMSAASFEYFAAAKRSGDLEDYLRPMRREMRRYRAIEVPLSTRVAAAVRRRLHPGR